MKELESSTLIHLPDSQRYPNLCFKFYFNPHSSSVTVGLLDDGKLTDTWTYYDPYYYYRNSQDQLVNTNIPDYRCWLISNYLFYVGANQRLNWYHLINKSVNQTQIGDSSSRLSSLQISLSPSETTLAVGVYNGFDNRIDLYNFTGTLDDFYLLEIETDQLPDDTDPHYFSHFKWLTSGSDLGISTMPQSNPDLNSDCDCLKVWSSQCYPFVNDLSDPNHGKIIGRMSPKIIQDGKYLYKDVILHTAKITRMIGSNRVEAKDYWYDPNYLEP